MDHYVGQIVDKLRELDLYEGGIRIPFIVSWPSKIKPNKTISHTAAFWDIMPTVVELSGNRMNSYTDGISLVPALSGQGKQRKHKYLYWEFHEDGGRQAVLVDHWKLIKLKAKSKQPVFNIYNIKKDPKEIHNLIDQHPKIAKELTAQLEAAHKESSVFPLYSTGR